MGTRRRIACVACIVIASLLRLMVALPTTIGAEAKGTHSSNTLQIKVLQQQNGGQTTRVVTTATFISGNYTLQSVEIDGTNAHLQILPNPFIPVLTFSSTVMHGMSLSHPMTNTTLLVISSTGDVTSTNVAIKTSVFRDLQASLGSFIDKADLLVLIAGGTVHHLVMKNVTLKIDNYFQAQNMNAPSLQLQVVNNL